MRTNLSKVSIICFVLGLMFFAKYYMVSLNSVVPKTQEYHPESAQTSVNASNEKNTSVELPKADVEVKVNYPDT